MDRPRFPGLTAVIPALDEEGSIRAVVAGLLARGVAAVVVGDNGSQDRTAAVARQAGATVVSAPRRGYGSACLAALAHLPRATRAVVFCDADGADNLDALDEVCLPVLSDEADLVIGSRVLGRAEPGALTPPQRYGNLLAAGCMRLLYRARVSDLGPFRCVSVAALQQLDMRDRDFGWTAEMQVKAYRLRLRVREVAVDARCRTAGRSKVSGRVIPVFRAGFTILHTIWRYHQLPLTVAPSVRQPAGSLSADPLASVPRESRS